MRVVTLNIWNRGDPWEKRLPIIRAGLEALQPDVVGLQEVIRLPDFDQAQLIADGLGYHIAFGRADDSLYPFGNAVLSRWPITRTEVFPLPKSGTDENRCLLFCEIAAPFGKVPFFTTHLNWKMHEGVVREKQVFFIAEKVAEVAPVGDFPPLLVGDFNAEPDAAEIRFLRGLQSMNGKSVYFADCYAICAGPGGATFSRMNPYAAVCREPDRRIDYIFVRGPDDRLRGEPLEARVCFDTPVEDVWPSDHFGVFARIST
jgi:endonuclease/exonuclease/phosphatase family metal-dependent hydrolase